MLERKTDHKDFQNCQKDIMHKSGIRDLICFCKGCSLYGKISLIILWSREICNSTFLLATFPKFIKSIKQIGFSYACFLRKKIIFSYFLLVVILPLISAKPLDITNCYFVGKFFEDFNLSLLHRDIPRLIL